MNAFYNTPGFRGFGLDQWIINKVWRFKFGRLVEVLQPFTAALALNTVDNH
jgi:hypothetical protein